MKEKDSQAQKLSIIGQIGEALSSGPEGFSVTISTIVEHAQERITVLNQASQGLLGELSETVLPKFRPKIGRRKKSTPSGPRRHKCSPGELDTGFFEAPPAPPVQPSGASVRNVSFNGIQLDPEQLLELGRITGSEFSDGAYWYDQASGAWGSEAKGPAGKIEAGLKLGGALREDASAGTTRIFINGRELGLWELVRLRIVWDFPAARYQMDSEGNFGTEDGPVIGNLRKMAIKKAAVVGALVLAQTVVGNAAPANNNSGGRPGRGIPGGILRTYDKCGCAVVGSGS